MKNKMKIGISLIALSLLIFNFLIINVAVGAYPIEKANLYSKGECGELLKKDGVKVRTTYIVYENNGKEYPAYCLEKEKPGVGESGNYTVNPSELISNVQVWRAIVNGFPYQSLKKLGCANEKEAFMATKMAVYSILYGYSIDNFSPIGEAGMRTWNALNQILYNARNGTETKVLPEIKLKPKEEIWKPDVVQKDYISKTIQVETNANIQSYEIQLEKSAIEGIKITDLQGKEQTKFAAGENFKILLPIMELKNVGNVRLKAKTEMETKPIFIGKAPNSNLQDYAITGDSYENSTGEIELPYGKNETEIKIVKMDSITKERLDGVNFQLLDKNKKVIFDNLITDKKGEIAIKSLLPGTYYIKEIRSKEEYLVYEEEIKIELQWNQQFTVKINNTKKEKEPIIEIEKTKTEKTVSQKEVKKLPKTGM